MSPRLALLLLLPLLGLAVVQEVKLDALANLITSATATKTPVLALFYVPWCQWCRLFIPVFESIEALAQPVVQGVKRPQFVRINMNNQPYEVLNRHQISHYPTLRIYSGGSEFTYPGELRSSAVLNWVADVTTSDIAVDSVESFDYLIKLHRNDVSIWFCNPDAAALKLYQSVPKKDQHVLYATVSNQTAVDALISRFKDRTDDVVSIKRILKSSREPFVMLLNPHSDSGMPDPDADVDIDDPPIGEAMQGRSSQEVRAHFFPEDGRPLSKATAADITSFIDTYRFPTVVRWRGTLGPQIVNSERPFLVAFLSSYDLDTAGNDEGDESSEGLQRLAELRMDQVDALWQVGTKLRKKALTMVAGTRRHEDRSLMGLLGVESAPKLVYVELGRDQNGKVRPTEKYYSSNLIDSLLDGDYPPEESKRAQRELQEYVVKWVELIEKGQIPPNIKSEEPLPDEMNQGPVVTLTGKDFAMKVLRSSDDWIVDFYAPWCGHCRVMAPLFETAAKAVKAMGKSIRFGKIDATANEVPSVHLLAYPTLLWYGKDKSHPTPLSSSFGTAESLLVELMNHLPHQKITKQQISHGLAKAAEEDDLPKLVEDEL